MTDDLTLNMNAYLPLRDVVFNTLREAILKGDLKPGERLMELQLASKLGVSRTPIREAIRMTLKDMEDVLEIRDALDELAVRIACQKITDEQLKQLEDVKELFEKNTQTNNVKNIAEADVSFHDVIYEATGNPKLVTLLNNLREQVYRYRVEYIKDPKNYPTLIAEHEAILDSLKNRDVKNAVEAMHVHVANQAEAVKMVIQEQE